ncbi:MAG: hypothetical protein ACW981_08640 [Candidatus Hodarchaeales archaeon]|jgi:hypothetical protein
MDEINISHNGNLGLKKIRDHLEYFLWYTGFIFFVSAFVYSLSEWSKVDSPNNLFLGVIYLTLTIFFIYTIYISISNRKNKILNKKFKEEEKFYQIKLKNEVKKFNLKEFLYGRIFCRICGQKTGKGDKFCSECGIRF